MNALSTPTMPLSAGFLDRRLPGAQVPKAYLGFFRGRVLVRDEALVWIAPEYATLTVLLGQFEGQAVYAADLSHLDEATLQAFGQPTDLWFLPHHIRGELLALACQGQHLLRWHARHPLCAKCGSKTDLKDEGRQRRCGACEIDLYPRTDPAVIMLVQSPDLQRVVLAHSHAMPPGLHSLLAGYVEPGETLEDTVRRETFEEAGLNVHSITYVASQPWALSGSLMCGFTCIAEQETLNIDPEELESAAWYSREELEQERQKSDFFISRRNTIARHLIDLWLES